MWRLPKSNSAICEFHLISIRLPFVMARLSTISNTEDLASSCWSVEDGGVTVMLLEIPQIQKNENCHIIGPTGIGPCTKYHSSSSKQFDSNVAGSLIMIKTKMMSKSNMAETNMAEIPIWRDIQHGWHSKKQRKYWQSRISAYINHSAVISSSSN